MEKETRRGNLLCEVHIAYLENYRVRPNEYESITEVRVPAGSLLYRSCERRRGLGETYESTNILDMSQCLV